VINLIKKISIVVGKYCNFKCKHCSVKKICAKLRNNEKELIIREVNNHKIKNILFVGGETTLYIKDINQVLSGLEGLKRKNIKITTNGSFAKDSNSAINTLNSFLKLDGVQLSYDIFHKEFLSFKNVENLYKACKKLKKDFSVILTISSPLDMVLVKELRKIGKFRIGVQKVLPIGRAIKNKVYFNSVKFDGRVLNKKCPGRKEIVYICGKGFTTCCSNLFYNTSIKGIVHKSIKEHRKSRFYKLISSYSFKKLAEVFSVEIPKDMPYLSLECNLCQYIFENGRRTNLWN
jgi:MoaA/NifB/PqqE/SkfB family radical SAM enzyme